MHSDMEVKDFQAAVDKVNNLTYNPGDKTLLYLYARYKQAYEGNNTTNRPGPFYPRKRIKWDAWAGLMDMPQQEAMRQYVEAANQLHDSIGLVE